ncbi:hypothetical protein BJX63DRAFT_427786 [Aspergillus granulosus]|uniref:Uncharacterized protein n=1 Tax=Aspergillus granulosus TaxID=176169 RepID=A0ABR4I033_9EURO
MPPWRRKENPLTDKVPLYLYKTAPNVPQSPDIGDGDSNSDRSDNEWVSQPRSEKSSMRSLIHSMVYHTCTQAASQEARLPDPVVDERPYTIILTAYVSFLIMMILDHIQDFSPNGSIRTYQHLMPQNGYA